MILSLVVLLSLFYYVFPPSQDSNTNLVMRKITLPIVIPCGSPFYFLLFRSFLSNFFNICFLSLAILATVVFTFHYFLAFNVNFVMKKYTSQSLSSLVVLLTFFLFRSFLYIRIFPLIFLF